MNSQEEQIQEDLRKFYNEIMTVVWNCPTFTEVESEKFLDSTFEFICQIAKKRIEELR